MLESAAVILKGKFHWRHFSLMYQIARNFRELFQKRAGIGRTGVEGQSNSRINRIAIQTSS